MRLKFIFAGLFLAAALPAFSQVVPSASQGGIPITVGLGFSNFYSDWSGYLSGATIWIDWDDLGVRKLRGLGIEAEGRDLNYNRTGDQPKLRQDTGSGGLIYHWKHFERVQPDAKFLIGLGSIDWNNHYNPYYTHDTRAVLSPGGGAEYRVWRNVWVRGDYEYQFWMHFYHDHAMNPEGFTAGVTYDLGHIHVQ
jgi:opacity protein-like surface antigen